MTLTREEKIARLRLWRTPRIGPATYTNVMDRFGTAVNAIAQLPEHIRAQGRKPPKIPTKTKIIQEIESLHKRGGRFIFAGAPEYPDVLRHVPDAPPVLAARGDLGLLQRPCIAIVGSRNASLNGKNLTRLYAQALGQAGFVIVSGLAKGIDAAAHQAALTSGTIAVVAGGIDVIYPRENQNLYEQIAEQGLILTEQPLGMPTNARLFPLRNRLVSGLSKGTLVVEANVRSGSLITARLATEQGREVFAVPGSPLEGRAQGTNHLIKQGATLVTAPEDILETFDMQVFPPSNASSLPRTKPVTVADITLTENLNQLKKRILENLSHDPVPIDALAAECEGTAAQMQPALADMEIAGLINRHPGGLISLAA